MSAKMVGIGGDFGAEKTWRIPRGNPLIPNSIPSNPPIIPRNPLANPQVVPPNPHHRFYIRETGIGDAV
jgi:hypothetical protein